MREMLAPRFAFGFALLPLAVTLACRSAGPYGYSVEYAPGDEETKTVAGSREFDPVVFDREKEEWRKGTVNLFGVVDSRAPGAQGAALLKLSVRRLEPRNLCKDPRDEDTCRVTVSDKDYGVVYAQVALHGDDDTGPKAVAAKSLVRLVGTFGEEVNATSGAPVLHASFYRHWPVGFYVSKDAR